MYPTKIRNPFADRLYPGQAPHVYSCQERPISVSHGMRFYRTHVGSVVAVHEGGDTAVAECVTVNGALRHLGLTNAPR